MIDRYAIYSSLENISQTLKLPVLNDNFHFKPKYNASPTQQLPIITQGQSQISLNFLWGGSPSLAQNKPLSAKLINHLLGSSVSSQSKKTIENQRCIIPCDGFFIWKQVAKKKQIPYFFKSDQKSLIFMAGTWEQYEDIDQNEFKTFRILTQPSNSPLDQFQSDMPILLDIEDINSWLSSNMTYEQCKSQIANLKYQSLNYYPVTPNIQYSEANAPELVLPSAPADQLGNYSLFD